jgi:hypothetical protein
MPENAKGALARLKYESLLISSQNNSRMKQLHNFLISITNTPLKSHSLDFRYQS